MTVENKNDHPDQQRAFQPRLGGARGQFDVVSPLLHHPDNRQLEAIEDDDKEGDTAPFEEIDPRVLEPEDEIAPVSAGRVLHPNIVERNNRAEKWRSGNY